MPDIHASVVPDASVETTGTINAALRSAILGMPDAIRGIVPGVATEVQTIAAALDMSQLRQVHLTGCGDSLYAGMAAAGYAGTLGLRADAPEALECSRYMVEGYDKSDLVIAFSNSGAVSRTIEATVRARAHGVPTVAITDTPGSALGGAADQVLLLGLPSVASGGAGTRSYAASIVGGYLLTAAIAAQRTGGGPELDMCVRALEAAAGDVERTIEQVAEDSVRAASWLGDRGTVVVLGAGPHLASACFGAAKLMEAASVHGVVQELEEWAHEQFHVTDESLPTILVGPPGASHDRAVEQARAVREVGGPLVVVTESGDDAYSPYAEFTVRAVNHQGEAFAPLSAAAVMALLAVDVADLRGTAMRMRLDDQRKRVNFRQIFNSSVVS